MKRKISLKKKVAFLKHHRKLSKLFFTTQDPDIEKELIYLARKELGYSKRTHGGDIARSLWQAWGQKISNETANEDWSPE